MQDNLAYRFFAFISYSSDDKNITKKIQDKIESYRLPTVLRNELETTTGKEYPQRVHPLCRDDTDLSVGLLGKSILRELEDSRFLLVICSPNSARSSWVNQEIENFILLGRYERIIPFIIEGVPNSGNPETECFPPILRKNREYVVYSHLSPKENAERQAKLHGFLDDIHDELKGVSLANEGPRNSRLKVIARMLEVSPDTIIQRDKQRQKKRIIWSSITALFFLILFTCLGLWTWDRYYRVHVGYFADYVEYRGVPRGVFPLSVEQRAHRRDHYRIYTQNQNVIRLEHVNSVGMPMPIDITEFKDRPMIAVYPIYKGGRLVQRDTLDRNGKVVISYYYSGDKMQKVEFRSLSNDNTASSTVLTNVTSLTTSLLDPAQEGNRGEIGNMRLVRDSKGRVIEERFQKGTYDVPTTDEQGIAGFRYKLDEYGRVIEKIYLDQDGNPRPDKQGVARRTNRYDDNGNLVEAKYFDANGNLTFNELGWMYSVDTFDEFGNSVETKFFDASGALCLDNNGIAGGKIRYDKRGNITEIAYFGVDDKPCLHKDGNAKITAKYDERGNITERAYFGIDDNPCFLTDSYAKVTVKYDERGNITEIAYFDVDNQPCLSNEGLAKFTVKYDERGNITEQAYFGTDGKPCLSKDGCAKVTWKYDERGNTTEIAYFDVDDKSCLRKDGNAKTTWKYDERGNETEAAYFGIDNKPCFHKDGYVKVTWKYDEHGNEIEEAYFGIDNKPCLSKEGLAKCTRKYDKRGNVTETAYFGVDDKPCFHKDGYAKFTWKYDEQGNRIEEAYFGIDNKPCLSKEGVAKISKKYDEQRKIIEEAFFSVDDKLCLCVDGYAKYTAKFDDRGNTTEQAYFGVDGKPCLHKDGYAKFTKKYDERGNVTEAVAWGIDNKLCLHEKGFARLIAKYDELGNVIETAYFDIDEKPCISKEGFARLSKKYDERGYLIEEAYFGIDDKPCLCNNGYAKLNKKFDERGNVIEITYFGVDGKPCLHEDGNSRITWKYDERGNKTETAYFGIDDKPCLCNNGYAKLNKKFDERGNVIEITYFGVDGKPCLHEDGNSRITWKYDERGNKTETAYFGIDDKPCLTDDEIAGVKSQFDEKNQEIRREFFGPDGAPCVLGGDDPYTGWEKAYYNNGNVAKQIWFYAIKPYRNILGKWVSEYDERGNNTSTYYLDVNDKPCLNDEDIAGFKSQFDDKNQEIRRDFFGTDGAPCVLGGDDPYTGWEKTFFDNGNIAKQIWFYTIKPYRNILGKWVSDYDERGNNTSTYYLDVNDKPCLNDEDIAGFKSQFDDKNQEIRRDFFGTDGAPCVLGGDDPYTGWEKTFFDNGNIAKQTWFYTIKPYRNILGKWVSEYDERGNNTLTYYLDVNNKPCLCDDGYAKITMKYDERGNEVEEAYFGVDGKPCLNKNSACSKVVWEYDEQGNTTDTIFYDIHGNKVIVSVIVKDVSPDSNAKKFGIQKGDFFILYDGQPVKDNESFIKQRADDETGEAPHELVVLRNNEFVVIQIYPGKLGCVLGPYALSEEQQKLILEKLKEVKTDSTSPETDKANKNSDN